ncbi:MAG TPA: hypothetical protein VGP93_04155 [Polyangiaceae bacterium]|jgi:hypothetical protein|nr:hypothetical protein [Polyangiaceae bacterium]
MTTPSHETDRLLEQLPVHEISAERAEAIRFELLAAARREPAPQQLGARSSRWQRRRVALLAAAALLCVAAAFALPAGMTKSRPLTASASAMPALGARHSAPHGAGLARAPTLAEPSAPAEAKASATPAEVQTSAQARVVRRITPAEYDRHFAEALALLNGGLPGRAAERFDALSREPGVDSGRRSDALFWAARAHDKAGHLRQSGARAEELARTEPGAWNGDDAALLAGKNRLARGDHAGARPWLERAARSERPEIRRDAQKLIEQLQ